jgi:hypothetical protein
MNDLINDIITGSGIRPENISGLWEKKNPAPEIKKKHISGAGNLKKKTFPAPEIKKKNHFRRRKLKKKHFRRAGNAINITLRNKPIKTRGCPGSTYCTFGTLLPATPQSTWLF